MNPAPSWLPPLLSLNSDWNQAIIQLRFIFDHDFISNTPMFGNRPVKVNRNPTEAPYHENGFQHVITRKNFRTGIREPDYFRSEKLAWCRAIIENYQDNEILWFDARESWGIGTYLWLENYDYLVVLKKVTTNSGFELAYLVTAYSIDGPRERNNLQRKYQNRIT